ncbi:MAG: SDR family NAD(P)-dependent oxidoreductase, partial [Nitrospinaceae bacterium]
MQRLKGRRALITGAGGPMGRAIALRFAREGAALALNDISANRLGETEARLLPLRDEEWMRTGGGQVTFRGDVTDAGAAEALIEAAMDGGNAGGGSGGPGSSGGKVDILVNVVGGIRGEINQPFDGLDAERWDDTFRLNLKGTFLLSRALGPAMRNNGYGRIVNLSSIDFAGAPFRADYGAAKAAVASLTRSLAAEFAPEVTVNCIAPGIIKTSALERLPES